jgi:signal transduction histidine kinase
VSDLFESGISDEAELLWATKPPTLKQSRLAFAVVIVLVVAFVILTPFTAIPLPRVNAFLPSLAGIIFVNDLITSALLFAQFSVSRSWALLALANGFLFTSLIVVPHALTFPGAFSPTGLLGAGLQSTPWLFSFWHTGFPVALLAYVLLKDQDISKHATWISPRAAIGLSAAITISLVCGLTLLATVGVNFLPRLLLDDLKLDPLVRYVNVGILLIFVVALGLLWTRRRSVLDLWLLVVACGWLPEVVLPAFFIMARFSFGFYTGRMYSLVTSTIVLLILLTETTRLYFRLARSNGMLKRERDSKLVNMEAMAASFSHEVRQPLAAIVTSGGAALRFLGQTPPDLEEIRLALNRIVRDGHRANQVFDSIGDLFRGADLEMRLVDMNRVALGVLEDLRGELNVHGIPVYTDLPFALPLVMGHRGQLREVMLNLIQNAIDAMASIQNGIHSLRVISQRFDNDTICVAIQDTGPGIDPEKLDSIFDAFVTTKPNGMGLGLAICRMIVERHGGQLSVWSEEKRSGALFQIILPISEPAHLSP